LSSDFKNINRFKLKTYGWIGLALILFAEAGVVLHQFGFEFAHYICDWTTPLCWSGYNLFIDSIINRIKGSSLVYNRRKDFCVQIISSIFFWIIFDAYNLHIKNWEYIGLPNKFILLSIYIGIANGVAIPGTLLTCELISTLQLFDKFKIKKLNVITKPIICYSVIFFGILFLSLPLAFNHDIAKYLFGFVVIGFFLLLEPIIYLYNKKDSLLEDLEHGKLHSIFNLFLAGFICGFLWEFWNYWSLTKWIYQSYATDKIHIFEASPIGFLMYAPIGLIYLSFYNFCKLFTKRDRYSVRR